MFQLPSLIYNLLYINYLYILYKRLLSLILLIGIGIDLAFIYHSLFFLSKAKELDVDQGCVSRSESQVKIQRILSSRFKPRRALLFASEVEIFAKGI